MSDKVLFIIGPNINLRNQEDTGGAINEFNEVIEDLGILKVKFLLFDTNKKNHKNLLFLLVSLIKVLFKEKKNYFSISIFSSADFMIISPILFIFRYLYHKKVYFKKIGGNLYDQVNTKNFLKRRYLKIILNGFDMVFVETKFLVDKISKINRLTYWYPNTRKRKVESRVNRKFNKKFVFMSQVMETKGIDMIIEASKKLPEDYIIDIYGPIRDVKYSSDNLTRGNLKYKGALSQNEVINNLKNYDVMLLPTFYPGEGYPGIIIESYSLGIPVISTKWKQIPEIVDEKCGILVDPKNVDELVKAILTFNIKNYQGMSKYAYEKFNEFESLSRTKEFLTFIGM